MFLAAVDSWSYVGDNVFSYIIKTKLHLLKETINYYVLF